MQCCSLRNVPPRPARLAAVCCLALTALGADGPGSVRFRADRPATTAPRSPAGGLQNTRAELPPRRPLLSRSRDDGAPRPARLPRLAQPAEPIAPGRELQDPAGFKPIGAVEPLIFTPRGELPPDAAAARFAAAGVVRQPIGAHRDWPLQVFAWQAPDMCHRPLYFEEVNLERYGYSFGLAQPFVSAAHFFGRVPMLPYLAGAYPPHECIYPLGHYRPGSYAPYQIHFPPPSARGALYEGGAVTGLIYLIP